MSSTTQAPRPTQIILWSNGRTACHLLERMLFSQQPNTSFLWHPHAIARRTQVEMLQEPSVAEGLAPALREAYVAKGLEANEAWASGLAEAKANNQIFMTHEHPQFCISPERALSFISSPTSPFSPPLNFLLVPDDLILHTGTIPIFTIRHPALTVPHAYITMRDLEIPMNRSNFLIVSYLGWQSDLYDYYVSRGVTPIVVEADDFMGDAEYVRGIARASGLDPEHCVFKWKAASEEEMDKMIPMFVKLQQTLLRSEGMVVEKVKKILDLDLDAEEKKWEKKFGKEGKNIVKEIVELSMPSYKYLKERKLNVK